LGAGGGEDAFVFLLKLPVDQVPTITINLSEFTGCVRHTELGLLLHQTK
jgi:hypothetical protein